jgi:hypothetical protein
MIPTALRAARDHGGYRLRLGENSSSQPPDAAGGHKCLLARFWAGLFESAGPACRSRCGLCKRKSGVYSTSRPE